MTTATTEATSISTLLREGTAVAHTEAENASFMANLIRGELAREDAVNLTAQYYFIYTALENIARRGRATNDAVASITDARLDRLPSLEADLAAMIGPNWREEITALPATTRYVAELEAISPDDAPAIIAHHYVRYLGDIAGGQVIARMLEGHYGLAAEELTFYDFSAIGKIPPFRKNYKDALDTLPFSDTERASLLAHAQNAFCLNSAVFADLASISPVLQGR